MSAVASQRLRRGDRVRERRDYQRISREGARMSSRSFIVLTAQTRDVTRLGPRLGITASRKVGSAVVRNRVKRRVREWFRRRRSQLPDARDIVVIARASAAQLDQGAIDAELDAVARRLESSGSVART